jgi:hypothetical protein
LITVRTVASIASQSFRTARSISTAAAAEIARNSASTSPRCASRIDLLPAQTVDLPLPRAEPARGLGISMVRVRARRGGGGGGGGGGVDGGGGGGGVDGGGGGVRKPGLYAYEFIFGGLHFCSKMGTCRGPQATVFNIFPSNFFCHLKLIFL